MVTSSGSLSASRTTIFPFSTMREGRTYSSMTSWWLNGALYCHGQWRVRGRPPTRISMVSQRSSVRAAQPASRLLIPGATPQSATTGTPARRAARSCSRKSSGMNEMSTYGRFAEITPPITSNPKRLGSAPSTRSAFVRRTSAAAFAAPPASAVSVRTLPPERARARSSDFRSVSATVTSNPGVAARSAAATLPTIPAPRTRTRMAQADSRFMTSCISRSPRPRSG